MSEAGDRLLPCLEEAEDVALSEVEEERRKMVVLMVVVMVSLSLDSGLENPNKCWRIRQS